MATVVDGQYTPLNGRMESEDNGKKRNLLGDTQGDVVELSQLITHPGMRKTESMEVLNLSIHQVCTKILRRLNIYSVCLVQYENKNAFQYAYRPLFTVWGGGLTDRELPDRDPRQRPPWTPPRQRPPFPGQRPPLWTDRDSPDRDPQTKTPPLAARQEVTSYRDPPKNHRQV